MLLTTTAQLTDDKISEAIKYDKQLDIPTFVQLPQMICEYIHQCIKTPQEAFFTAKHFITLGVDDENLIKQFILDTVDEDKDRIIEAVKTFPRKITTANNGIPPTSIKTTDMLDWFMTNYKFEENATLENRIALFYLIAKGIQVKYVNQTGPFKKHNIFKDIAQKRNNKELEHIIDLHLEANIHNYT
jgi:hypothetical protein